MQDKQEREIGLYTVLMQCHGGEIPVAIVSADSEHAAMGKFHARMDERTTWPDEICWVGESTRDAAEYFRACPVNPDFDLI